MIFDGGPPGAHIHIDPPPALPRQSDAYSSPVNTSSALPPGTSSPRNLDNPDTFPSDSSPLDSSPPPHLDASPPPHLDTFPTAALLLAAADRKTPPETIAADFGIDLLRYLDWLADPATQRRIAALQEARDAIKRELDQEAHDDAVAILRGLMHSTPDDVEKRRCATAIVRSRLSPRNHRLTARAGAAPRSHAPALPTLPTAPAHIGCPPHQSPPLRSALTAAARTPTATVAPARNARTPISAIINAAAAEPSPILTPPPPRGQTPRESDPADITSLLLLRLQDSDNPAPGDGLRMLFHFLHPNARAEIAHAAHRAGIKARFADDDLIGPAKFAAPNEFAALPIRLAHHELVGHSAAVLQQPVYSDPESNGENLTADVAVSFTDIRGRISTAIFTYGRDTTTADWRIVTLHIIPVDRPPDPSYLAHLALDDFDDDLDDEEADEEADEDGAEDDPESVEGIEATAEIKSENDTAEALTPENAIDGQTDPGQSPDPALIAQCLPASGTLANTS